MNLINRLVFLCILILNSYSLIKSNEFDAGCLNGPDFWCLNATTEALCDITNRTIGVCGFSSKRCVEKTGKHKKEKNRTIFVLFFS